MALLAGSNCSFGGVPMRRWNAASCARCSWCWRWRAWLFKRANHFIALLLRRGRHLAGMRQRRAIVHRIFAPPLQLAQDGSFAGIHDGCCRLRRCPKALVARGALQAWFFRGKLILCIRRRSQGEATRTSSLRNRHCAAGGAQAILVEQCKQPTKVWAL